MTDTRAGEASTQRTNDLNECKPGLAAMTLAFKNGYDPPFSGINRYLRGGHRHRRGHKVSCTMICNHGPDKHSKNGHNYSYQRHHKKFLHLVRWYEKDTHEQNHVNNHPNEIGSGDICTGLMFRILVRGRRWNESHLCGRVFFIFL